MVRSSYTILTALIDMCTLGTFTDIVVICCCLVDDIVVDVATV